MSDKVDMNTGPKLCLVQMNLNFGLARIDLVLIFGSFLD